jgi:hypothetical protein
MRRMSGRPAEKHISAQEFCTNCRARHFERGRACLHYWVEKLGGVSKQNVRRIGDQKSRNQGAAHVVSMTPFRGLTRFLLAEHYNCENRIFSNTFVSFPSRPSAIETPYLLGGKIITSCASIAGLLFVPPFLRFLDLNFSPNTPATETL